MLFELAKFFIKPTLNNNTFSSSSLKVPDGVTSPLKGLRESNVSLFAYSSKALPTVDFPVPFIA